MKLKIVERDDVHMRPCWESVRRVERESFFDIMDPTTVASTMERVVHEALNLRLGYSEMRLSYDHDTDTLYACTVRDGTRGLQDALAETMRAAHHHAVVLDGVSHELRRTDERVTKGGAKARRRQRRERAERNRALAEKLEQAKRGIGHAFDPRRVEQAVRALDVDMWKRR